jgi:CHAT domain
MAWTAPKLTGRCFGRSLCRIDVDGPWPGPGVSSEDVIERLIDALFDPERRLASQPNPGTPIQVQHFSCHCRTDNQTDSGYALILGGPGQERSVTLGDIGTGFRQRNQRLGPIDGPRSLIIANACGSAKIDKESRRSFQRWFLNNHHRGFVGTEIDVPVDLAADFGVQLYREVLDSKPLGEAVVRARRWLLTERRSPLGLLYVLYGDPDLTIQASPSRSSS